MPFETDKWITETDDVSRTLPHAVGMEKSILSTMLQDPQEFIPLAMEEGLTERYFYLPNHAALFAILVERFTNGKEIELVSLIQYLIDTGKLDKMGGPSAITDIYTYSPSTSRFRPHIVSLREKFTGREILRIGNESAAAVYDEPEAVQETLANLEREVMAIRDMGNGEKPQTVKQAAMIVVDKLQRELNRDPTSKGISTGFADLDRMTNGQHPGEMGIIGARPSVGKTALLANIIDHVCLTESIPVLFFSAEMTTEAITKRMIFSRAKYSLSELSRGVMPIKSDLIRIQKATMEIAESKLHIDDRSGPSISYISAKARRMKREHGIGMICIDYLGLVKSMSKQSQSSREREIAEISAGAKAMAKDLGVPVILLAQLNRDVDKRATNSTPGRPRMSDLRDSGSIEQDADWIGLLSRESYQNPADDNGSACLDLVKNRNGATGPIALTFIADIMRFESGAPAREPESAPKSRFGN
jgi:replicative DNA helicase